MRSHQRALALRGQRLSMEIRQPYLPPDRPDWFQDRRRACAPTWGNNHLFVSDDKKERGKAVKICQKKCPFRIECLGWAVEHKEKHYVWGGLDFSKASTRTGAAA